MFRQAGITILAFLAIFAIAVPARADLHTVRKTADTNDGVCDADCSLREAIAVSLAGDDIDFSLPGSAPWTIRLSSGLSVATDLGIIGPGSATDLSVSGDSDSNGTGNFRVLSVSAAGNLSLVNLPI